MHKIILLFLIFLSISVNAQNSIADSISAHALQEVRISTYHINDSLLNAPAAIGILAPNDLTRNNYSDIAPAINTISGVQMQSGAYNTNRISIRGIGARTPFGTNKIRAFYGSIPLTSGDSETTIEDLNTENIAQTEIIKGPLSSLYGAGLGGAILIDPSIQNTVGSHAIVSSTFGSFALNKTSISYNVGTKFSAANFNYYKINSDGWRQNSGYDREGFTVAGEFFRKASGKLSYLANYTWMKAFIPSSINREAFETNPQSAAPTWRAAKGYEQYKSYLGGLGYDFNFFKGFKNSTSVFINVKNSDEPRPFDILTQNTLGWGARTQFSVAFDILKFKSNAIIGTEYFRDGFTGKTFENLYQTNNGNGSARGNKITESEQLRKFYNAFAQLRIQVAKKWEVQTGVNVNKTQFQLENIFPADSRSMQDYSYNQIWSPQFSLLFKASKFSTVYASASHGFSLPSVEETLTINGTVNTNIRPESGYNFEIGGKSYFLSQRLFADFAIYRMQIKDLLVAQRVDDDQYVGVNAGRTIHQGIEASVNYSYPIAKEIALRTYFSGSIGNFEFEEFLDNNNNHSGNKLPGVPSAKFNGGTTIKISGWHFSADFQYVDKMPINDSNTVFNEAWRTLNLKTGWNFRLNTLLDASFSAGVNNVFDEHYASMVLVNATAPPNGTPRYYYPGLPVNYYFNMNFSYRF